MLDYGDECWEGTYEKSLDKKTFRDVRKCQMFEQMADLSATVRACGKNMWLAVRATNHDPDRAV